MEDLDGVSEEHGIEVPLNGERPMYSDLIGSILDRVELALRSGPVPRQESERRFLKRLLGELGGGLPSGIPSPADLSGAAPRPPLDAERAAGSLSPAFAAADGSDSAGDGESRHRRNRRHRACSGAGV